MVSLNGQEDVTREYMSSTGMTSSLYESTVWEELTGYESVSTISILAKAQEENVDILLISSANLYTEIEKLNTDETTKQSVINAVNSGMVVTIPAEEITMGEWSGTGYIVANPETGAGEYIISGGLNGGSVPEIVSSFMLLLVFLSINIQSVLVGNVTAELSGLILAVPFFTEEALLILLYALVVVGSFAIFYDVYRNYMDKITENDSESTEEKEDENTETDGGKDEEEESKRNKIPDNDSVTGHIFSDEEGHIPDTPENRELLEEVANDEENFRGVDKYGNEWYTKTLDDGRQVWVEARNGNIWDGGINNVPKPWNPQTGLKKE